MIISIWNKALKGDIQAFNSIRRCRRKPSDVVENINYTKEKQKNIKIT